MPTPHQTRGGRWRVRVRNPDPAPGKAGYTSATFATRPEADQFCRDVEQRGVGWALAEYRRGSGNGGPTLDEWAARHFAALTAPSPETVHRYRTIYESTWRPTLGHLPLEVITRTHVAGALNAVGGTDKTRRNKWVVLSHMLRTAATEGLIPRSPASGVKVGRRTDHEREEHRYLTHAEFLAVLTALPEHWRPLVLVAAGTGARWGELAALNVGDYDAEGANLRITKAAKVDPATPGRVFVGPTKSRRSRRTIAVSSRVAAVLDGLTAGRAATERLFLRPDGEPLRHRTFYDVWLSAAAAVPEPRPRFHDLRHSHVAWLIAEGVSLPVIQARLGHEKITTTIDTYGHLMPDLQRAAADAADLALAGLDRLMPKALG